MLPAQSLAILLYVYLIPRVKMLRDQVLKLTISIDARLWKFDCSAIRTALWDVCITERNSVPIIPKHQLIEDFLPRSLPVMFWSTLATFFMTIACATCPTWIGFIAVRVLQGFFATSAQVIGMTVIQDMYVCFQYILQQEKNAHTHRFYFEEHARKIGIWGWSILIGPYFGPFLSSLILHNITWRQSFWVVVALVGIGLLLIIFLMEETTYDRTNPDNNPTRPAEYWRYKLLSLTGIMGHRANGRQTLWQGTMGLVSVFIKPQFYLLCKPLEE